MKYRSGGTEDLDKHTDYFVGNIGNCASHTKQLIGPTKYFLRRTKYFVGFTKYFAGGTNFFVGGTRYLVC